MVSDSDNERQGWLARLWRRLTSQEHESFWNFVSLLPDGCVLIFGVIGGVLALFAWLAQLLIF